jgi:hypothetical protein
MRAERAGVGMTSSDGGTVGIDATNRVPNAPAAHARHVGAIRAVRATEDPHVLDDRLLVRHRDYNRRFLCDHPPESA